MTSNNHQALEKLIGEMLLQTLGEGLTVKSMQLQGGGCINNGIKVETQTGSFFIKWNELEHDDMFRKEAAGLSLLAETGGLSVPKVFGYGKVDHQSFLVLDYIVSNNDSKKYWQTLGEGLARLHQCKSPLHGLSGHNYIGRLLQSNLQRDSWVEFFVQQRLNTQVELTYGNGYINRAFVSRFELFTEKIPNLIPESAASLLHGDLWSGNVLKGPKGEGFFIDPAVYYGSREMDLSMTHLFGGFDRHFYDAYGANYPLEPGFKTRVEILNLYPLLVHANLFGASSGYLGEIERILNKYI